MGWKNGISVNVLDISLYYCHVKVNESSASPSYYITFIYGPPVQSNRHLLWNWISEVSKTINEPWLLLGDFNQIISAEDKLSSSGMTSGMNIFKETMEQSDLSLISHQGPNFTWTNKRKHTHECLERIDLAFCNLQWSTLFPSCFVQHMGIAASDHSPILLHSKPQFKRSKGRKFEKLWYFFPECINVIRDCWSQPSRGSPMFSLHCKLTYTLSALYSWSGSQVGNIPFRIKAGEDQLNKLSSQLLPNS